MGNIQSSKDLLFLQVLAHKALQLNLKSTSQPQNRTSYATYIEQEQHVLLMIPDVNYWYQ